MQPLNYRRLTTATIAAYSFSTIYDFLSSLALLSRGYIEMNPLAFLGMSQYWLIFWTLSIILPVVLLEFGSRWAFMLLWVPYAVHTVCTLNNIFVGLA